MNTLFGFDFAAGMAPSDWTFIMRCFQKLHLLSHSTGIVATKYIQATGDQEAVVGRKVIIRSAEVSALVAVLRTFGVLLAKNIAKIPAQPVP